VFPPKGKPCNVNERNDGSKPEYPSFGARATPSLYINLAHDRLSDVIDSIFFGRSQVLGKNKRREEVTRKEVQEGRLRKGSKGKEAKERKRTKGDAEKGTQERSAGKKVQESRGRSEAQAEERRCRKNMQERRRQKVVAGKEQRKGGARK
jgi:hypothetical protein